MLFAATLYVYLTLRASIDEAVSRGRHAIQTFHGVDEAEWGRFILQLQAATGFLFSAAEREQGHAEPPPLIRVQRRFGTVAGRTTGADVGGLFDALNRTLIEIDERYDREEPGGEAVGIQDWSTHQNRSASAANEADSLVPPSTSPNPRATRRETPHMETNDRTYTSIATARQYRDFSLELRNFDPKEDTYELTLLPSDEFGEPPVARVRLAAEDLSDLLDDLEDKRIDLEDLIRLGQSLTDRLFPTGPIREHFVAAVKAAGQDYGVRLRLMIRDSYLAQFPWEYSYLQIRGGQQDRTHFLVLDPQISLVRHVPFDQPQPSLTPRDRDELSLVVAFANPAGTRELNLRRERKVIEKALDAVNVEGVIIKVDAMLDDPAPEELRTALQQKADLFHFAGHGMFQEQDIDPATGEPVGAGSILLVRDKGTREPYYLVASDLALQLQGAGVRVAVLGACESGRHDQVSAWTGVAPALVGRGIPAVVAMQYEIEDSAAITFSEGLYTGLAAGLSMDEAVYAGRLAILSKAGEDDVEWGVPALYLRSGDGVIFPTLAERPSSTRDQLRILVDQTVTLVKKGGSVIGIDIEHLDVSEGRLGDALQNLEVHAKVGTLEGTLTGIKIGKATGSRRPERRRDDEE